MQARENEETKRLQALNQEWNKKMAQMQEEHILRAKILNEDWGKRMDGAVKSNQEQIHDLQQQNIELKSKLDQLEEKNEKCGIGNHTQCVLELEQLKIVQLEEMKNLSDQLEAQRTASDAEKAKLRLDCSREVDRQI